MRKFALRHGEGSLCLRDVFNRVGHLPRPGHFYSRREGRDRNRIKGHRRVEAREGNAIALAPAWQFVGDQKCPVEPDVDEPVAHREAQLVFFPHLDSAGDHAGSRVGRLPVNGVRDLHLRPSLVGTGVDEVRILPGFVEVKTKGHRAIGRASGGGVTAAQFEVAGVCLAAAQHRSLATRQGLEQLAALVFPALADQFPAIRRRIKVIVQPGARRSRRVPYWRSDGRIGPGLGAGEILCRGRDFFLCGGKSIPPHMLPRRGGPLLARQGDGLDGRGKGGEERGHSGRDRNVLVRLSRIAAKVEESLGIGLIVESPRNAALFKIDHAGHRIEPHLMRFEEGTEVVIIDRLDGIILVVVTLRAVKSEPEKGLAGALDRVVEPGRAVEEVIIPRQKAGRTHGLGVSRREFIGGEHLRDHTVVAFVLVERFDDPVAPVPEMFLTVAQLIPQPVPVAVAPHIHPVPRPALAVLRTREEFIDDRLVRPLVAELFRRGRQADEIEIESSQEEAPPGLGLRLQTLFAVFYREKSIDRISRLRPNRHGRSLDAAE